MRSLVIVLLLALQVGWTDAFAPAGLGTWILGNRGRAPTFRGICSVSMQMVPPPPPPKRSPNQPGLPPPPPPRDLKSSRPEREAGEWRDAVREAWVPRPNPNEGAKVVRARKSADQLREERQRKERQEKKNKNEPPPLPMLTILEWQKALSISGAKDFYQLYAQLEHAKAGNFAALETKWLKDGASRAEIKKRVGQAMAIRNEAKAFALGERPWAEGKKFSRPPKGEFFRYMHKQEKFDGRVLPMSMPKRTGVSEGQYELPKTMFRPALEASRGSDSKRQLPAFNDRAKQGMPRSGGGGTRGK